MIAIKISKLRPYHLDRVSLLPKSPCIVYITKRWASPPTKKEPCCPNVARRVKESCDKTRTSLLDPCKLDPSYPQPKVLIIGAGLAGLSAANRLAQCGLQNFQVIEALDRPGGRIHSCWLGNEVGELGPNWINSATIANPVYSLGAQEGLLKEPLQWRREQPISQTPFLTTEGRTIDSFIAIPAMKLFKKIKQQALSLFSMDNAKEQGDLQEFFFMRLNDQVKLIPDDWKGDALRVIWGMINGLKSRWGVRINFMSSEMYGSSIQLPGAALRIPIGMVGLLGPLLKPLSQCQIRYCSPVQEIIWSSCCPRVTVVLCNEQITADYVIVTTSLGVLKNAPRNFFTPELPSWKKHAIKALGYGKLTRIILEYKRPFWMVGEGTMRFCWTEKELDMRDSWIKGIDKIEDIGSPNKLVVTVGGKEADWLEGCSEEDIAEEMTRIIRQFTGNPSIPYPTGLIKSKWISSPYFRGCNAYLAQGSTINDVCSLGTPLPGPESPGVPIVLFAGEATAPGHVSSLLGAHISGVREADRIIGLTKKFRGRPPVEEGIAGK
ncbi:peroxisomal N(1)-acetyl-spermine/spermidine oxidase [Halyomorpha halys]|uniref:peroxisomal N(1)-acetyl-spermine/spermidine oxidase n=1 Tax=Halyomorpha halys TaxID=286706 RepID=UPI0006D4D3FF|nr:peroxisomal N(1)-acetyl-spermine/spermidine oxidase [Halyomorpha halys]